MAASAQPYIEWLTTTSGQLSQAATQATTSAAAYEAAFAATIVCCGPSAATMGKGTASKASRKTITRLAGEWKSMEPRKKASLLAALLGAAAAASVPLVRKSLKK